jgi:hypothetical protein
VKIALGVMSLFTIILVVVCVLDYKETKKLETMKKELAQR